jgi:hypothetical protein
MVTGLTESVQTLVRPFETSIRIEETFVLKCLRDLMNQLVATTCITEIVSILWSARTRFIIAITSGRLDLGAGGSAPVYGAFRPFIIGRSTCR